MNGWMAIAYDSIADWASIWLPILLVVSCLHSQRCDFGLARQVRPSRPASARAHVFAPRLNLVLTREFLSFLSLSATCVYQYYCV